MPIYTYECQSCSSTLERRQSFNDAPLTTHDDCGGSLRRVIHPAGIVFKGSGFYNTDYKNGTGSTKPSDASSSDTAKAETTADSGANGSASTNGTASTADSSSPTKSEPATAATP